MMALGEAWGSLGGIYLSQVALAERVFLWHLGSIRANCAAF
jgi:hypothetical protein